MKYKRLFASLIASAVIVTPLTSFAAYAEEEIQIVFSTWNTAGVSNGPSVETQFTPESDVYVYSISTYHWNYGDGSPAGTISVYEGETLIGEWDAIGSNVDACWTAYPSLTLKAGHTYTFGDSDPDTWSCNSSSGNRGFVEVRAAKSKSTATPGAYSFLGKWKYAETSGSGETVVVYYEFKDDGTMIFKNYVNGELKQEEYHEWFAKDGVIYDVNSSIPVHYSVEGDKLTLAANEEFAVVLDRVLPQPLGDVNNDEKIDSKDATAILVEYSARATGGAPTLIEEAIDAADANKDTKVDSKDASAILSYYSYTATGGKDSLEDFLFPKEK